MRGAGVASSRPDAIFVSTWCMIALSTTGPAQQAPAQLARAQPMHFSRSSMLIFVRRSTVSGARAYGSAIIGWIYPDRTRRVDTTCWLHCC